MATERDNKDEFDYIVVGSGAGGGPLAANLAKAGYTVLLLEAGGDCENFNYQVPCFHGFATEDEQLRWDFFVKHYENQQQARRDSKYQLQRDGVLYPRAGTLGGCTAHNAMITILPHASDWDGIAKATRDESWRAEHMHRYFERLEACQYVNPPGRGRSKWNSVLAGLLRTLGVNGANNPGRHGFDGWLTTNTADPKLGIHDPQLIDVLAGAAFTALKEGVERPNFDFFGFSRLKSHFDPNDAREARISPEGLCVTPLATRGGRRTGAREYVRHVQRDHPNLLTVRLNSLVSRVVFDDSNAAIGVEYLEGEHLYRADPNANGDQGIPRFVRATREVVLSGGAFNSPQLLMLSGIGSPEELARHNLKVRVELPGVGRNLQDRYEVGVISRLRADLVLLRGLKFQPPAEGEQGDAAWAEWQQGRGIYSTNGAVLGVVKRSSKAKADPDLFIFGLPGYFKGYFPGYSRQLEKDKNFFTWAVLKAHTENTAGRVTLHSADPRDTPDVVFHYFEEGNDGLMSDLDAVVDGVQFVRRMLSHADLAVAEEILPGPTVRTLEEMRQYVQNEAWGHHASCSNKMGPLDDPMAVVDSNFCVHGTRNLRVVDASVFPRIPGFFIVTAVYMISEKASDAILATARKQAPADNYAQAGKSA